MRRTRVLAALAIATALAVPAATTAAPGTGVVYDDFDRPGYGEADYDAKWFHPYGLLEADPAHRPGARSFDGGRLTVAAVPFRIGADFSVFDHLKYFAASRSVFPVPEKGYIEFSSRIAATTPGTIDGLTLHGVFQDGAMSPFSHVVREGQQAGVVMNVIDFCTGQLFDWFVSGTTAFSLVERLPTNVTGNTSNPGCPDATHVGLDEAYTQIVEEHPVDPGRAHEVAIRYSAHQGEGRVEFFLDGRRTAKLRHVGVPLDVQDVDFSGDAPSLGPGEELGDEIGSFTLGHGLFSLLDAFPYQHPERPDLAVSFPVGTGDPADAGRTRLFGQGAVGSWDDFTVRTSHPDRP